jgi:hypothetical protein
MRHSTSALLASLPRLCLSLATRYSPKFPASSCPLRSLASVSLAHCSLFPQTPCLVQFVITPNLLPHTVRYNSKLPASYTSLQNAKHLSLSLFRTILI